MAIKKIIIHRTDMNAENTQYNIADYFVTVAANIVIQV